MIVFGAGGLLGSNVAHIARRRGEDPVGTYHSTRPSMEGTFEQVDIRNQDQVEAVLKAYPSGPVINCAAMTDVDESEKNPDRAFAINAEGPRRIAAVCDEMGRTIVHVSSDYVFDGSRDSPYGESEASNPIQTYGQSKEAGDQAIREEASKALIIRPSFVYGIHRSSEELVGFPSWVRDQLQTGNSVPLFTDQYVTPSRAGQCAETILDLLDEDVTGTVHSACRSCVTPYKFGQLVREFLNAPPSLIKRGSMNDIDRPAKRPTYTCLDVSRLQKYLGNPQPSLEEDVAEIFPA